MFGKYIVDFICVEEKLIIEIDGSGHNYSRDKERTEYFNSRGFKVLRFWNNEIDKNIEGVVEKIISSPYGRGLRRGGNYENL